MEQVLGFIERITFHNPENGFTVARLQEPKKKELTTIVGVLPLLQPGVSVSCEGCWKFSANHGIQFEVKSFEMQAPKDLLGIQKYLESGLIKGIGPAFAERIIKAFGINTLKVIDETPHKLLQVPGIGEKKLERISYCWSSQKSIREVMIFLQHYDVSPSFAQRIFKVYGDKSVKILKEEPYKIASDIFGIGFKTADTIAKKLGIALHDPMRLQAGIEYVLYELTHDGHVCYPREELITLAATMLEVESDKIINALLELIENKKIVSENGFIWLKLFYLSERGIVREVERLLKSKSNLRDVDGAKAVSWVEEHLKLKLADNQKKAVEKALQDKFLIITGGPGTGKSTITKAILKIIENLTSKIILAAPTGRAAKRMAEITKREAKTIHSLLEWSFASGGFKKGKDLPLICDLIIIDEASMIDTILMLQLLKAIPNHARVLFLGDIHQLPSVGAGNVLKDFIKSEKIPVVLLTEIFRQAKGSRIITNAHRINEGRYPDTSNASHSDFFFLECDEPEEIVKTIVDLVTKRLPSTYKFDPINEIQILTPMKKGPLGTERLNHVLQEVLTPTETPLFLGGKSFHLHDKVMQIKNNYEKEVFNGDVGRIVGIDSSEQEVIISFDGKKVVYDFSELDEIVLAYAVSVHKYQGSECPCIIMPIHTTHYILLHRNLLYTGVTRGKKLVILVGTPKALHIAIQNDEVKQRNTGLYDFLTLRA